MCPECGSRVIPIEYGYVDHATIERAILGFVYIAERYDLAKFYCKECKIKLTEID
jgi:hypothetical protein